MRSPADQPNTAPGCTWVEPHPADLDRLTHLGAGAADTAVMRAPLGATGAERTRLAVRAALRALLANQMITVPTEYPAYFQMDPPR